jgi:hypothetical protein
MKKAPTAEPGKRKSAIDVQIAAARRNLAQWLDQKYGSRHRAAIQIALLETAFDRHLADRATALSELHAAAADALDMIQPIIRRAVQRRRVVLHRTTSLTTRAIPINDEELANRLTEMLNVLDAIAAPLPKDAPLRQFIDHAANPLGALLGYFVGVIEQPSRLHNTAPSKWVPFPLATGSEPTPDPTDPQIEPAVTPFPVEEWS